MALRDTTCATFGARRLLAVLASLAALIALDCPGRASASTHHIPYGDIYFGSPTRAIGHCARGSCYEPSVAVDSEGRVFVTDGIGDAVAVSSDGGSTFRLHRVPPGPSGARRSGDAIVQIDRHGRLVYSQLFDSGFLVAVSTNAGRSWSSNTFITTYGPDRQWIGFGPGNAVYAIWKSARLLPSPMGPLVVIVGYWTATSTDGGRTFGLPEPFLPTIDIFTVGPPLVDRSGRVYVPLITGFYTAGVVEQSVAVAVSSVAIGSGSFVIHTVTNDGADYFPIGALDGRGNLSVAWHSYAHGGQIRVSRSIDHGNHWSRPVTWSDGRAYTSPWIGLRGGRQDVLWYSARHVDLTRGSPKGSGRRVASVAWALPATDYADFAYLLDGRIIAVFTDDSGVWVTVELPPATKHR